LQKILKEFCQFQSLEPQTCKQVILELEFFFSFIQIYTTPAAEAAFNAIMREIKRIGKKDIFFDSEELINLKN